MDKSSSLLRQLVEELSAQCWYEKVCRRVLEENHLTEEMVTLPRCATEGSAGADFFTPVAIDLKPGEQMLVPTGVKAHCAAYTRLTIVPKSGLGFRYYLRLANTVGTVDADYYSNPSNDGCIFVKIRNEGNADLHLEKGAAFCQGIFELYIPDRDFFGQEHQQREGGFGSTNARVRQ